MSIRRLIVTIVLAACTLISMIIPIVHWEWFMVACIISVLDISTSNKPKRKHLTSFGNYLLSDERRKSFEQHPHFGSENIEERLKQVHHADIENWKSKNK